MTEFRIRDSHFTYNEKEAERRHRAYMAHLKKAKNKHHVLWKYFGLDFFHDGYIQDLKFSNELKNLTFRIDCPNILKFDFKKRKYKNQSGVWVRCEFSEVAYFEMETPRTKRGGPLFEKVNQQEYLYSEIDSLKEKIRFFERNYGKKFHSLMISLCPFKRYMSIIFHDVKVVPENPKFFQKLLKGKEYYLPLYQRPLNAAQKKVFPPPSKNA